MRILHLTIKKKWFDLIASRKKMIEYREYKDHWKKHLLNGLELKKFDEVHFRNGYHPNSPFMRVEHRGTVICGSDNCYPTNGEELNGAYFLILLGEVLEVNNGTR